MNAAVGTSNFEFSSLYIESKEHMTIMYLLTFECSNNYTKETQTSSKNLSSQCKNNYKKSDFQQSAQ